MVPRGADVVVDRLLRSVRSCRELVREPHGPHGASRELAGSARERAEPVQLVTAEERDHGRPVLPGIKPGK